MLFYSETGSWFELLPVWFVLLLELNAESSGVQQYRLLAYSFHTTVEPGIMWIRRYIQARFKGLDTPLICCLLCFYSTPLPYLFVSMWQST